MTDENVKDPEFFQKLTEKLVAVAWHRHHIRRVDALDVMQTTMVTWLEVKDRYQDVENRLGLLLGIFHNKCLEYIDGSVREAKKLKGISGSPAARSADLPSLKDAAEDSTLAAVMKREEGELILAALSELRPEARDMFRLIADEEIDRKDLIRRYGLNKNTLDSRLRAFRQELRSILSRRGIHI